MSIVKDFRKAQFHPKVRFGINDVFYNIFPDRNDPQNEDEDLAQNNDTGTITSIEIYNDGSVYYRFMADDYLTTRDIRDDDLDGHDLELRCDNPSPQPKFWPGQYVRILHGKNAGDIRMIEEADIGRSKDTEGWRYIFGKEKSGALIEYGENYLEAYEAPVTQGESPIA